MKVSKVVLIVVALHVLVIGGIVVFEGCSRSKTSTPDMAANESSDSTMPGATNGQSASIPNPQGPSAPNSLAPNSVAGNETMAPTVPAPVVASVSTAAAHTYVVKKGDSLWKISKAENVSVGELSRANNLTKTSSLKVGQKLTVPVMAKTEKTNIATASVVPTSVDATTSSPTMSTAATAAATDAGIGSYTVKSGDSLWKIARLQNVSVAALKQANNLSGDSLKVGQKLHLPTASAKAATDMTANTVSAGVAPTSSTTWQAPGTYQENGQTIHIVDFNESPATIAKKYGIKTDDLLKANNITDPKKVQYGQKLMIPQQPVATTTTAATPVANPAPTPAVASTAPVAAAPVATASHTTVQ
jgi:LysM repeat protein